MATEEVLGPRAADSPITRTYHAAKQDLRGPGGRLLVGGIVALALSLFVASKADVPLNDLTRDAAAVSGSPWYTGSLSTLGVLTWAASGSIALLVGGIRSAPGLRWFGALTIALALDDALMLHEAALPELAGGAAEGVLFALYGLAALVGVYRERRSLRTPGSSLVLVGGLFLASSIAIDVTEITKVIYVEDSFKLVGQLAWSGGLIARSQHELVSPRLPPPD